MRSGETALLGFVEAAPEDAAVPTAMADGYLEPLACRSALDEKREQTWTRTLEPHRRGGLFAARPTPMM